jgi:hypothetical protein
MLNLEVQTVTTRRKTDIETKKMETNTSLFYTVVPTDMCE